MNFYLACMEAKNGLAGLSGKIVSERAKGYVKSIMDTVAAITDNDTISATRRNLGSVNALFQSMRRAFKVPRMGKLSDEIPDDDSIHDRCSLIIEHMNVFLHAGIPSHIRTAARIIMERYRRRETMLFANNAEHTISEDKQRYGKVLQETEKKREEENREHEHGDCAHKDR